MLNNEQTKKIVGDILIERLSAQRLIGTEIDFVEDFDGEPIVRVTARLKEALYQSDLLSQAEDDIRDRLLAEGDNRFVFVRQVSSDQNFDHQSNEDSIESDHR